ncbi:tetratricopeptide repeat protein [Roseibium sp.]|uniref:tetratricopeptide repeat protein n=1 Tax=Roseibium sp. TaxID=1936156 RepID=UPI003D110D0C
MERRLAAILAIDMIGYSRLMAADESGTLKRLKQHRSRLIDPRLAEYRGRIVKTTGDGLLGEFHSVVDAVRCAVMIQLSVAEAEADVPADQRILYRAGVNLGDVLFEDEDMFGDRVNVAARLEELAEPGGICVSRTVVEHVRGRVASRFEDLGPRNVKNIPEPVQVFRVLMAPEKKGSAPAPVPAVRRLIKPFAVTTLLAVVLSAAALVFWQPWRVVTETASVKDMAFPLPDKPSLVVLPFADLGGRSGQEYLADGITNDLITDLSKFRNLFVIAANSAFTYKGKPVKIQEVAEDFGVRYVLEGSVQAAGETVRINAQLIDAINGYHLWAERYVGDLDDLLALQNRVVDSVVAELAVKLETGEGQRTNNAHGLAAPSYMLFGRASTILPEYFADRSDLANARDLFQELVAREPEFSGGYAGLSRSYSLAVFRGYATTPDADRADALRYAERALELDPRDKLARLALAEANFLLGRHDEAVTILEQIMQSSPSSADAHGRLGLFLVLLGRPDEAAAHIKSAIRLNPYSGSPYLNYLGLAEFVAGRYGAAVSAFEENTAQGGPIDDAGLAVLAASYHALGRSAEENVTLTRLFDRYPGTHLRSFWLIRNFAHQKDRNAVMASFKRAGIPMDRPYTR